MGDSEGLGRNIFIEFDDRKKDFIVPKLEKTRKSYVVHDDWMNEATSARKLGHEEVQHCKRIKPPRW